jgi:nitrate reductase (NAD(P)H)
MTDSEAIFSWSNTSTDATNTDIDTGLSDGSGSSPKRPKKYLESREVYPFQWRQDTPLTDILDVDLKTKDFHVPRDERLVRLTGSHPFNCEPPSALSFSQGFITPTNLHFVRNHGPVPQVSDNEIPDWTFQVEGLVDEPFTMDIKTMIQEFAQYTNPITLCCAGNRRREQNVVKKGKGFDWYQNGISTALWTGSMLWDVIQKAKPAKGARYLWMEGADDPAKGAYGTSIPLHFVRDPERCIMLAYKHNGISLLPDHGKPLRVIIPGMIGGRSVKWLKRLVVSNTPSDNWYHYYDNKVLPTMVTPEIAAKEDHWWKEENYAIYDLNVQSITVHPVHDEVMIIDDQTENDYYDIKGFAYNGGGKRIGRVEISLDRGKSWILAQIDYPEDRYRDAGPVELFGGTVNVYERFSSLCWCFWNLSVQKKELKSAKEILVRAMDVSMIVQPRNMYWNVTSMLNNWWYRVAIQPGELPNEIKFQHPTSPTKTDGWMDRVKKQGGDLLDNTWGEDDEDSSTPKKKEEYVDEELLMMLNPEKKDVIVTKAQLKEHENAEDPWFVVKGHVFEGTPFLDEHPGGIQSITNVAGEDATDDFVAIHSDNSKRMLQKFHIGKLEEDKKEDKELNEVQQVVEKTATLLNPKVWKKITLFNKEIISRDSRIFHFELEHAEQTTGLPVGMHFFIRLKGEDGKFVMRAYTPKSNHKTKGKLEILIKVYFPKDDIPGGKMTMLMENLKVGEQIEIKGPTGEFEYLSNGNFKFNHKPARTDSILFIGGGSGITPCYQIISEIVDHEEDNTKMRFFFGNRTEEDILCAKDLEEFAARKNANLQIDLALSDYHTIRKDWPGLQGRLSKLLWTQYIEEQKQNGEFMVMVCGPPGMVNGVKKFVEETGLDPDRVVYF